MQTSSQSMYNKLILITFFLLALATWWLRQQIGEPLESYSITSTNAPDYWIEHIAARIMDEQGKLRRILGAEKLQHFPTTNKSELIKPKLDFLNSKTPPWKVRADTGWIEADGALLVLPGLVTIDQDSAPGILPVHLETKDLKIRPKEQYAETEQTVKINNGLSHLQAKGLQIWLKPPIRIKLPAAVRAHYEITK